MRNNKFIAGLESEKLWIDTHPEYYENTQHQELVKTNVEIRYRVIGMLRKLNSIGEP